MSDDTDYTQTGAKLNQKFDDLEGQIEAIDGSGGDDGSSGDGIITLDIQQLAAALPPHLDYEAVAEQVAGRIDTGGLTEDEVQGLIEQLIEDHEQNYDHGQTEIDYDQLAEEVAARIDTSGSIPGDELEKLRRERERFSLVGMPNHTRTIVPGDHEDDDYHRHGSWGLVVTAHEDVVWRKAAVNAEAAGSTQLEIFEMDYEQDTTYQVGDRLETHEVTIDGAGENSIHPDIVLEAGQTLFITRETAAGVGEALPLKRSAVDVDWGAINDNDIPMTIHCTWQRGRGQPGTADFQTYRDNNWHRILHYYRGLEFGFNTEA